MNKSLVTNVLRISAALIVCLLLFAIGLPTYARTAHVPANVSWQDTGIRVEQGQVLTISASGAAITSADVAGSSSGPAGQSVMCPDPNNPAVAESPCLLNGAPYGALVGRIGAGAPFLVGASYQTTAAAAGKLFLGVNDHLDAASVGDNQGGYDTQITRVFPNAAWCASADPAVVFGCAEIVVKPDGAAADFFEGETLLATGQNPGQLVLPPGNHRVNVRITQSPEPGFGTLFVYRDTVASLSITENNIRKTTVTPQKQFIRGTLALTCDIRNAVPEDGLNCQVSIDGAVQTDLVAPGAKKDYILDPGPHAITVNVVGTNATLWAPASQAKTITISKGVTTQHKPRFDKMGHIVASLNQPGVVGDFYVDGTLAATQVATYAGWVAPSKNHRIDVKALSDPAAAGQWTWKDATASVTVNPGADKPVVVTLQKQWLVGFIELTCTVTNYQPGQNVFCIPFLDGVQQADVAPGAIVTYTVSPGQHKLDVTLGPPADIGTAQPAATTLNVRAGQTSKYNARLTAVIPTFDVTLVNNSYAPVCNVFLSLSGSAQWGNDRLASTIAPGASMVFRLEKGVWDMYAQNCQTNPLSVQYGVSVTAPVTWVVTGPVVTGGSQITLEIFNQSSLPVCEVYLAPSSHPDWGTDWLGPDQALLPGQSRKFLLTSGTWDMLVLSCDGYTYWQRYEWTLTSSTRLTLLD